MNIIFQSGQCFSLTVCIMPVSIWDPLWIRGQDKMTLLQNLSMVESWRLRNVIKLQQSICQVNLGFWGWRVNWETGTQNIILVTVGWISGFFLETAFKFSQCNWISFLVTWTSALYSFINRVQLKFCMNIENWKTTLQSLVWLFFRILPVRVTNKRETKANPKKKNRAVCHLPWTSRKSSDILGHFLGSYSPSTAGLSMSLCFSLFLKIEIFRCYIQPLSSILFDL